MKNLLVARTAVIPFPSSGLDVCCQYKLLLLESSRVVGEMGTAL